MKRTTYVAAKPLVIDSRPVKPGEVLATVESDHDISRLLSGIAGGSIVPEEDSRSVAAEKPTAGKGK